MLCYCLLMETFSSSAVAAFFLVRHATKLLRSRDCVLFSELLTLYIARRKRWANKCWTDEWMNNFKPSLGMAPSVMAQSLQGNTHYKYMTVCIQCYMSDMNKAMQGIQRQPQYYQVFHIHWNYLHFFPKDFCHWRDLYSLSNLASLFYWKVRSKSLSHCPRLGK